MPERTLDEKVPSARPREGDPPAEGEVALDRGGVEVEANRERMDVLGRRKGREPRDDEGEGV